MKARRHIRAYLDHLTDREYVSSIFTLTDVPTISDLLTEMIRGGDSADVTDATRFLRDAIDCRMLPAFADHMPRSAILNALAEGVIADHHAIRRSCVQTLGDLGGLGAESILTAALPRSIERDPLLLPDLLTSLSWLTGYPGIVKRWVRLRAAAKQQSSSEDASPFRTHE